MPRSGERTRAPARRPSKRRSKQRAPWLRVAVPLAVLGLVGFLYWHPISTYVETRGQLERRQREVTDLQAGKSLLEARLEQSSSLAALAREARRIGLVRPGEQLFIVKGIPAWREARADDR